MSIGVHSANKKDQAINRSSTRFFTIDGETHCLSDWAVLVGLHPTAIQKAIAGKSQEDAQKTVESYARRKL